MTTNKPNPTEATPAVRRAMVVLGNQDPGLTRDALAAGFDVEDVARVLNLHASFKASSEIQDPNIPWYWECDGCDTRLALSGTYGRADVIAALAAHQAAALHAAIIGPDVVWPGAIVTTRVGAP